MARSERQAQGIHLPRRGRARGGPAVGLAFISHWRACDSFGALEGRSPAQLAVHYSTARAHERQSRLSGVQPCASHTSAAYKRQEPGDLLTQEPGSRSCSLNRSRSMFTCNTTGSMAAFGSGPLQHLHILLVAIILVEFCGLASCGGTDDTHQFPPEKKDMSPIMIGVFLAALACLVVATQSAFAAYLGVAVAKQWPEPKLSGIPYNDRMQICCSASDVSLYSLNIGLAVSWVVALAIYTWVWCDLTGSNGCCTDWVCLLVGLVFWMMPGLHVVVAVYMTTKFVQLGWPLSGFEASYVPVPGSVVTGVPDVVPGMPADDELGLLVEE
ncbi:unnamed protein product [Ostreobium quekettii]|uniref:Uncharacterized protein n=1 Tax=Ostreobium quekettii TaxID=121088 RepID=A0A8S1JF42_9CHLO|nr:unnamed protein product [Ostreobium quekettii]|eukprot:evm.model.scf_1901.3 EVM.evm.TU.scf_1901.3   scf_1901:15007-16949(+)